ncbi:glycosyl transferase [Rozella allomycis CSF55]|uniref:Alpha-1,4 glucan phosphorylase n=1 Tax=Rozella allomycis (strain CSF55) TaxID=988480 RepID=A0A4P9YP90_ROZAC|nr:glycosyl transferase [Rozella allomycis CSF55]
MWNDTQQHHTHEDVKRVYYLSLEFLLGRSLDNTLLNMQCKELYRDALKGLGFRLEDLIEEECDAALGNGGLGRLAACFMDSLASMDYPAWGYGLRYTYGIFQQRIVDGYQVEYPDFWLNFDNPWEFPRLDVVYEVRFYGSVTKISDTKDETAKYSWAGGEVVQAVAYDVPIPGWNTKNTINIRLWSSKPKKKFDLKSFNEGNYQKSVEEQQMAENITSVLYPNDNTMAGKELRLKQQYFFICATLKDIVRRFKKMGHPWKEFPNKVAIQLNDTHPSLSIPELMRRLVDIEGLPWDEAWGIVTRTFAFTNHTVLPEALEKWPVPMMNRLLPRHLQIIYDINLYFLQNVEKIFPNDRDKLSRMSIIEEGYPQQVRMANLAVIGSHTVNGVAEIHSLLVKHEIFKDFVDYFGVLKFQNKTNGITPRRWLLQANPGLSELITEALGNDEWIGDLSLLKGLKKFADDEIFQEKWIQAKYSSKEKLCQYIKDVCDIQINPDSIFDVQVKRIHEYKRQFMNILAVIHSYLQLKNSSVEKRESFIPRTVIFAGKAAPGYYIAKLIIKLINSVADVVNKDKETNQFLKVVFIPDYNVSAAEVIIPASDVSQHISTAGTEASGTSNMKFVLNGGLIIGTLDGANIEIKDQVGQENIFIFGCQAHQVNDIRHTQKYRKLVLNPYLESVIAALKEDRFCKWEIIAPLIETLTVGGDFYLISHDFQSCNNSLLSLLDLEAISNVQKSYQDRRGWAKKSILAAAGMGMFSSDRTIKEYAQDIWKLTPCRVP